MYAQNELGQPDRRMGCRPAGVRRSVDLASSFSCVCTDWLRGQEFENRSLRGLGLIGREQMAGVFEQDELCAGNARGNGVPPFGRPRQD